MQEWAQSRALAPPRYEEVERSGPAHAPHFVMRVVLDGLRAGARRRQFEAGRGTGRGAGLSRPLGRDVSETRCGFVAIIGAPNAGKSTLINALVGEKVSIVTRKAQTTRSTVRGVLTRGEAQIVFVDTPGLFAPKRRLDRAMVASAWGAAADADALMLMIDARKEVGQASLSEETQSILAALGELGKPRLAVLNKIDLVERPKLLELAARLNAALAFDETFMVSAATGDGLDRLLDRLAAMIPPGPWLYPEDQIAEAPIRSLAAEITREKLIERLHDELPYQATVETDELEGPARRLGAHRADDLRHPREPPQDRARRGRAHDQGDRHGRAQGHRASPRRARAPLPARQGARALARRPGALPGDGARVPQAIAAREIAALAVIANAARRVVEFACVRMESPMREARRRSNPGNEGRPTIPGLLRFARNDDRGSTELQFALAGGLAKPYGARSRRQFPGLFAAVFRKFSL